MFLKVRNFQIIHKRYIQALYVQPEHRQGNQIAVEVQLDYAKRLSNRPQFEQTLKRRGADRIVDIPKLYEQWQQFKEAEKRKRNVIPRLKYWRDIIDGDIIKPDITIQMAKVKLKNAENDWKLVNKELDAVEAIFYSNYLQLPNDLLEKTPNETQIVFDFGDKCENECSSHLARDESIKYINESLYYLKGAAARFDLLFPIRCTEYFERNKFTLFNNPDFARTVVIEGAGVPLEKTFLIPRHCHENFTNLIHLPGNGSMMSFLGFLCNIIFDCSLMPMQWVAAGKIYQPIDENLVGLYDVAQSTAVHVFIVCAKKQVDEKYSKTLDLILELLKTLNIHFRVVNVAAKDLHSTECFATNIEMYAPNLRRYIEIGRVSNYGDFISRRLNFHCAGDKKFAGQKPNIVSATVCNVTKLLAIILETNNGEIPPDLFENKEI